MPRVEPRAAADPTRRTPPARIFLYVILGEHVAPVGAPVRTEVLVAALGLVDVHEKAARQAIARLAADGMLAGARDGRRVRWQLTERGRRWLGEGRARSVRFHEPADASIGDWLVLNVTLRDDQRDLRYHLNRRLVSLGWGSIGAGTWLNSGAVPEDAVVATLRRLGLDATATMMRARFVAPTRVADLVERAWDIPSLGERYRRYLAAHRGREPRTDADAFARRTRVVAEFTHLFWTDPRLPADLLPARWPGAAAMQLVRHAYVDWRAAAQRWWSDASA